MTPAVQRILRMRLTSTEQLVGATLLAGTVIFVGILVDMPTVKRAKSLELERRALSTDVAGLTEQLDRLAAQRVEVETEAARLKSTPPDPRVSSLMRELTAIEDQPEVRFGSIKPMAPTSPGTAVLVEVSAPLKLLGPYLDQLEQSRWAIRIRDLQLTRNPERVPSVSARFVAETAVHVRGLGPADASGKDGP